MEDKEKLKKYKEWLKNIKQDILLNIALFGGDSERAPYLHTKMKKYDDLCCVIENLERKIKLKENKNE